MKMNFDESVASWQIQHMLALQDQINTKVHPAWREQNNPWCRAIWTECAELLDHYGWKWWKHQEPDMPQVRLELVDIWHFGLSWLLQQSRSEDEITQELIQVFRHAEVHKVSFPHLVETLAHSAIGHKQFMPVQFARLMCSVEMSLDELYRYYVGKNVLNSFRQENGYRAGGYRKTWTGKEDNEHLHELLLTLDSQDPFFMEQLYRGLSERYQATY